MGGDQAPSAPVAGALRAVQEDGTQVILVGDEAKVREALRALGVEAALPERLTIQHAEEAVGMDEPAITPLRKKRRSSIRICAEMVRGRRADAMVSAGNTGAAMIAAKVGIGLAPRSRPAGARGGAPERHRPDRAARRRRQHRPQAARTCVEFAVMGRSTPRRSAASPSPRVGLLSIGEEEGKGTELTREVFRSLERSDLNFVGNVEGCDIFEGTLRRDRVRRLRRQRGAQERRGAGGDAAEHDPRGDRQEPARAAGRRPVQAGVPAACARGPTTTQYGGAPLLGLDGGCFIAPRPRQRRWRCRTPFGAPTRSPKRGPTPASAKVSPSSTSRPKRPKVSIDRALGRPRWRAAPGREPRGQGAVSGARKPRARIAGTGHAVPERRLTNADLERMVETSATSGSSRAPASASAGSPGPDEAISTFAMPAPRRKRSRCAGVDPADVDLIIVRHGDPGHADPRHRLPRCRTQLGCPRAAAFDISAGCSGFVYALSIAEQFIENGPAKTRPGRSAARCSAKFIDWTDRTTCVLFGDGAGAVVLAATERAAQRRARHRAAQRRRARRLHPHAGRRQPPPADDPRRLEQRLQFIKMKGNETFKIAVRSHRRGVSDEVLAQVRPHARRRRLVHPAPGQPAHHRRRRRAPGHPGRSAATSTSTATATPRPASIPIALDELNRAGRIEAWRRRADVGLRRRPHLGRRGGALADPTAGPLRMRHPRAASEALVSAGSTGAELRLLFPARAPSARHGARAGRASASARGVREADAALGFSLSRLCFEGPEDELEPDGEHPARPPHRVDRRSSARSLPRQAAGRRDGAPGTAWASTRALVAAGALELRRRGAPGAAARRAHAGGGAGGRGRHGRGPRPRRRGESRRLAAAAEARGRGLRRGQPQRARPDGDRRPRGGGGARRGDWPRSAARARRGAAAGLGALPLAADGAGARRAWPRCSRPRRSAIRESRW